MRTEDNCRSDFDSSSDSETYSGMLLKDCESSTEGSFDKVRTWLDDNPILGPNVIIQSSITGKLFKLWNDTGLFNFSYILDQLIEHMGFQPLKLVTNCEEIHTDFNVEDGTKCLTSMRPLECAWSSTIDTKTSMTNTHPMKEISLNPGKS